MITFSIYIGYKVHAMNINRFEICPWFYARSRIKLKVKAFTYDFMSNVLISFWKVRRELLSAISNIKWKWTYLWKLVKPFISVESHIGQLTSKEIFAMNQLKIFLRLSCAIHLWINEFYLAISFFNTHILKLFKLYLR